MIDRHMWGTGTDGEYTWLGGDWQWVPRKKTMTEKPLWGPWSPDLEHEERCRQLRSLATLVWVSRLHGQAPVNDLMVELRKAEFNAFALERSRAMFDILPALAQRHIMASFTAINHGIDLSAA